MTDSVLFPIKKWKTTIDMYKRRLQNNILYKQIKENCYYDVPFFNLFYDFGFCFLHTYWMWNQRNRRVSVVDENYAHSLEITLADKKDNQDMLYLSNSCSGFAFLASNSFSFAIKQKTEQRHISLLLSVLQTATL